MLTLGERLIGEKLAAALGPKGLVRIDDKFYRADVDTSTAFLQTELQYVQQQVFLVKKVALRFRDFFYINHEAHPGASIVAWDLWDTRGEAAVVEQYNRDFPRVDASKTRQRNVVFSLGASYGYTIQELREVAMSGSRLDMMRALQARRAHEAKLEKIAAKGLPLIGITGAVNDVDVDIFGTTFSWDWSTTSQEMIRGVNALVNQIVVNTKQVWAPNVLLLPTNAFALMTKPYSDFDARTVLEVFLKQSPYIKKIDQWVELDGAGASGKDRIMAYNDSQEVIDVNIPQEYEEMPPEPELMEFVIATHSRTAGAIVRYPQAIEYGDGDFDVTAGVV